jgi:hypothetical protein
MGSLGPLYSFATASAPFAVAFVLIRALGLGGVDVC